MDMSNPQFRAVLIEILRRAAALILFIAAATAGLGYGQTLVALAGVVLAVLVYILPPRPRVPESAMHHERMPTVYMPDLLGFMLATVFFALPLVVSAQEPWRGGPWGLLLVTVVPGLIALLIFWVAIRHQCSWLRVTGHDLTVADPGRLTEVPFREIAEVTAETAAPPLWLKPFLVLRDLGLALLTAERPRHALVVAKRDGTRLRIPTDAFPDMLKVLAAFDHGGVTLAAPLKALLGKTHRHHARASKTGKAARRGRA